MLVLAIETSHDDTSVVIYQNRKISHDFSTSQSQFHAQFGGTVPEWASRHHAKQLALVLEKVKQVVNLGDIDLVAFTATPGLFGSLQMGRVFAEAIGLALSRPVLPINHLHAHVLATAFENELVYPALALVVSGGHTTFFEVKNVATFKELAATSDDAVGEVFDKIGRRLGLPFPGGPELAKLADAFSGEPINFKLRAEDDLALAFAGLKTKVLSYIDKHKDDADFNKSAVAAGFQKAVVQYLVSKTQTALKTCHFASLIVGGGVAANNLLRSELKKLHPVTQIPSKKYCTDNAAMIAISADLLTKASKLHKS